MTTFIFVIRPDPTDVLGKYVFTDVLAFVLFSGDTGTDAMSLIFISEYLDCLFSEVPACVPKLVMVFRKVGESPIQIFFRKSVYEFIQKNKSGFPNLQEI